MLLDFSVKNFGPFANRITLSMQATKGDELSENKLNSSIVKDGILSSTIIFGANSSGKSFVIQAISALKDMVSDLYEIDHEYRWYTPFRLSKETMNAPVEMEIRLIIDDILYDYSISYSHNRIISESLYYYPSKYRTCVFNRNINNEIPFEKGTKELIQMTTVSSSYLSVASRFNDNICGKVYGAINKIVILNNDSSLETIMTCDLADKDPKIKTMVIDALRTADLGIVDFYRSDKMQSDDSKISSGKIMLKHDFTDSNVSDGQKTFPMNIESEGTKQMFGTIGPIANSLDKGNVLLIDEFGSFMHPALTRWIIEQYSSDNNPNGAQLIVNTHDLSLMDIKTLLRRDQIFFTNKDRGSGSSELYSLSDFKGVRKDTDVLKTYLFGRYDAVPNIIARRAR